MLTVHHLNDSRSQKIVWLLEELELPFEIVHYTRDPVTLMGPPALKALHPLGKSPVLGEDGKLLTESGAIVDYVLARYGQGRLAPIRRVQTICGSSNACILPCRRRPIRS